MSTFSKIYRSLKFRIRKFKASSWLFLSKNISFLRFFYETRNTESGATFNIWFFQKVLGFNRDTYWPVHYRSTVNIPKNIYVGIGSAPGLAPGCYIQGIGNLFIGDYVGIGPNVGILSGTHQIFDLRKYKSDFVKIGDYSWIGMNSTILPGVELGQFTIVRAGSLVMDSFVDGYCVIGGNPAKLIKKFPPESYHLFVKYKHEYEYHGYIPKEKFENFRKNNLWI